MIKNKTIINRFVIRRKSSIYGAKLPRPPRVFLPVDSLQDPIRRKSCECVDCGRILKKLVPESLHPWLPQKAAHIINKLIEVNRFKSTENIYDQDSLLDKPPEFASKSPSIRVVGDSTKKIILKAKVTKQKHKVGHKSFTETR